MIYQNHDSKTSKKPQKGHKQPQSTKNHHVRIDIHSQQKNYTKKGEPKLSLQYFLPLTKGDYSAVGSKRISKPKVSSISQTQNSFSVRRRIL